MNAACQPTARGITAASSGPAQFAQSSARILPTDFHGTSSIGITPGSTVRILHRAPAGRARGRLVARATAGPLVRVQRAGVDGQGALGDRVTAGRRPQPKADALGTGPSAERCGWPLRRLIRPAFRFPQHRPGSLPAVHPAAAQTVLDSTPGRGLIAGLELNDRFHYWRRIGRSDIIAKACGLPISKTMALAFERHLPIDPRFHFSPNLDALFTYASGPVRQYGVECKFGEPFSSRTKLGLKAKYLDNGLADLWTTLPNLRGLAKKLCPDNSI